MYFIPCPRMMTNSKIVRGPPLTFAEELEEFTLDEYVILLAKRRYDDVYLVDALSGEELMMSEFLQKSHSLAAELQHLGCGKNTIVGIICENRLEYSIVLLGTIMTGATLTCFNPAYGEDELRALFNITKPKIVFCSSRVLGTLKRIVPSSNTTIVFDAEEYSSNLISSCLHFSPLVRSNKPFIRVKKKPDDAVTILYSSGTTGLPKGVTLTHKNFVYQLKLAEYAKGYSTENDESRMTIMNVAPMFHGYGFMSLLSAIIRKEKFIIMSKFEERLYLSTIQKYRVNIISVVPTILNYLLKDPSVNEYDLSSVVIVRCGSAPLKSETEKAFLQKFTHVKEIQKGYGLTEGTLLSLATLSESVKPGSSGSPLPGVQIKVVNSRTGRVLGKNEMGEIRVKGPHIMKGYYGDPKATAATFDKDGWLRTGDLGYYDEDGDFFIVDRVKELIKYKGYQVAPAELEALLITHPAVVDCGVVGIPDSVAGELPRAYVVKRVGAEVTENEIIQYVAAKVSPPKRLRGGVEFVSEIPKNGTGKILRRKLRDLWIAKTVISKL